ncbi:MAG: hypothetical protein ACOCVM_06045 [Desulfovibrionaceae bacterium]
MKRWTGAAMVLAMILAAGAAGAGQAKVDVSEQFKAMHGLYKQAAEHGREVEALRRQCRGRACEFPARELELAFQTLRLIIAHVQDLSILYQFASYEPAMQAQVNQHIFRRMDGFVAETYRVKDMLEAASQSGDERVAELAAYYADVLKDVKIQLLVLKVKFEG